MLQPTAQTSPVARSCRQVDVAPVSQRIPAQSPDQFSFSFSDPTPVVSAKAALLMQAHPEMTTAQIADQLRNPTSASTPVVSGMAALLMQAHPEMTTAQVADQLRTTFQADQDKPYHQGDPVQLDNAYYDRSRGVLVQFYNDGTVVNG